MEIGLPGVMDIHVLAVRVVGAQIRSGTGSSSFVRDDRCRKCGQLIDWSGVNAYN